MYGKRAVLMVRGVERCKDDLTKNYKQIFNYFNLLRIYYFFQMINEVCLL